MRGHMGSAAGEVDETVAERLLGGKKGQTKGLGTPDVRAASAEEESPEEPK